LRRNQKKQKSRPRKAGEEIAGWASSDDPRAVEDAMRDRRRQRRDGSCGRTRVCVVENRGDRGRYGERGHNIARYPYLIVRLRVAWNLLKAATARVVALLNSRAAADYFGSGR
jgi:hypothetical protein